MQDHEISCISNYADSCNLEQQNYSVNKLSYARVLNVFHGKQGKHVIKKNAA